MGKRCVEWRGVQWAPAALVDVSSQDSYCRRFLPPTLEPVAFDLPHVAAMAQQKRVFRVVHSARIPAAHRSAFTKELQGIDGQSAHGVDHHHRAVSAKAAGNRLHGFSASHSGDDGPWRHPWPATLGRGRPLRCMRAERRCQASLSRPRLTATVRNPCRAAICIPRLPRPPERISHSPRIVRRPIHPISARKITAFPQVGGLHHRYERRAA
jgi:hypothetical protein